MARTTFQETGRGDERNHSQALPHMQEGAKGLSHALALDAYDAFPQTRTKKQATSVQRY